LTSVRREKRTNRHHFYQVELIYNVSLVVTGYITNPCGNHLCSARLRKSIMHCKFMNLCSLMFCGVNGHLFVGNPPPFRAHQDISLLIMPLNGDPNAVPPISQQPFPCKGHHVDLDGPQGDPVARWSAGQRVTFSYVPKFTPNHMLTCCEAL
jgi:hypothetical protein